VLQVSGFPPLAADDHIELVAAPDVPGVEVMRVHATARLWRWYHETYTVCTPIRPMRTEWQYRNRLHRTDPLTIALMEPGEVHAEVSKLDEHESFRALLISPAVMCEAARDTGAPTGEVHWRENAALHGDLFRECLHLHAALEAERSALERQTRFTNLVGRLAGTLCQGGQREPSAPLGEPAAVRRVRALLHERWADNVQLDDLVAVSGVDRFRLLRAFRRAVGLPPHAYQIHIRVARAMTLIRLGMPLVDVALQTGFADQSHLSRHFTRVVGVPPGRYQPRGTLTAAAWVEACRLTDAP
jgi:AraC-like DNA-binding protein